VLAGAPAWPGTHGLIHHQLRQQLGAADKAEREAEPPLLVTLASR
jgi:hypothetical protein